jgi:predicted nucleic acid-binding protein
VRPVVLDAHLYVEAARDPTRAAELASFSSAALPFLHLHAVVAQELLAGARGADGRERIQAWLIHPFERRNRLMVPSWRAWRRAGEMLSELVDRGTLSPGGFSRSFMNDALIAASLRDRGAILVTGNSRDFSRLSQVESFTFETPWPASHERSRGSQTPE